MQIVVNILLVTITSRDTQADVSFVADVEWSSPPLSALTVSPELLVPGVSLKQLRQQQVKHKERFLLMLRVVWCWNDCQAVELPLDISRSSLVRCELTAPEKKGWGQPSWNLKPLSSLCSVLSFTYRYESPAGEFSYNPSCVLSPLMCDFSGM